MDRIITIGSLNNTKINLGNHKGSNKGVYDYLLETYAIDTVGTSTFVESLKPKADIMTPHKILCDESIGKGHTGTLAMDSLYKEGSYRMKLIEIRPNEDPMSTIVICHISARLLTKSSLFLKWQLSGLKDIAKEFSSKCPTVISLTGLSESLPKQISHFEKGIAGKYDRATSLIDPNNNQSLVDYLYVSNKSNIEETGNIYVSLEDEEYSGTHAKIRIKH